MTTFAEARDDLGLKPVVYVELRLSFCNLSFGVLPCSAGNLLSENQTEVETGADGFLGINDGVVSQSLVEFHGGAASLQVDSDRSVESASGFETDKDEARRGVPPAATTVFANFWFKGTAGQDYEAFIRFYQTDGTFISDSAAVTFSGTGSWEQKLTGTQAIPANTGLATLAVRHTGAAASDTFYYDDGFLMLSDGIDKCYNTYQTCPAKQDYDPTTKSYWLCSENVLAPVNNAIPCVQKWSRSPTSIDPEGKLGRRARFVIDCQDSKISDYGIDKYPTTRSYDLNQGTFFAKLRRRNRNYFGREVIVYTGYEGMDISDFRQERFELANFAGPTSTGKVTLTFQDVLKRAQGDKVTVPAASNGVLELDLSAVGTSMTLLPAGIGDLEYPSGQFYVRIDDEVIIVTRSSDVLTVVTRGHRTTAEAHSSGASVQLCAEYTDQLFHEVLYDILTTSVGIDASKIDKSNWDTEVDTWRPFSNVERLITIPTAVDELIHELCELNQCAIWDDPVLQKVRLVALKPSTSSDASLSDDENFIANTLVPEDQSEKRLTTIIVFYDQRDPTLETDDRANYRRIVVFNDSDAVSANEYGVPAIKVLFAPWFTPDQNPAIVTLGGGLLQRYRNPPKKLKFDLHVKDDVETGDIVRVSTRLLQDVEGANEVTEFLVTEHRPKVEGAIMEFIAHSTGYNQGRVPKIMDDAATEDYEDATDDEIADGAYICDSNNNMPSDGSDGWQIV